MSAAERDDRGANGPGASGSGPTGSGATAATIGIALWVVVLLALGYGVTETIIQVTQLFG